MTYSISSDFLLRDYAPIQIFLYSIPAVNIFVRLFQSQHSLDGFKNGDFSPNNIKQFEERKERFKSYLTTAVLIQSAMAITAFVSCILFHSNDLVLKVGSHACSGFGIGALTSFLYDQMLRSDSMVPRLANGNANGNIVITGY